MFMFKCRSIDNFVQAYRDMSPARVAMANSIKRSFTQMAVVSYSLEQASYLHPRVIMRWFTYSLYKRDQFKLFR